MAAWPTRAGIYIQGESGASHMSTSKTRALMMGGSKERGKAGGGNLRHDTSHTRILCRDMQHLHPPVI